MLASEKHQVQIARVRDVVNGQIIVAVQKCIVTNIVGSTYTNEWNVPK